MLSREESEAEQAVARPQVTVIPREQHAISRKDISENALKVMYRLNKAGYEAWLVGGGVRDLGIACGQGFFIARPAPTPRTLPESDTLAALKNRQIAIFPNAGGAGGSTARALSHFIEPIAPDACNDMVYQRFEDNPELHVLPVVHQGQPLGLINRHNLIDRFARPFRRELYGKKPCTLFMDPAPLVVDHQLPVQEVSRMVSRASSHYLQDGFVITENGVGSSPSSLSGTGTGTIVVMSGPSATRRCRRPGRSRSPR